MLSKLAALIDIGDQFKLKGNTGIANASGYGSVGEIISVLLPNIYLAAGLILFVFTIAAGFVIITSTDNPQQKEKGTKILSSTLIGFILVFTSFWLIKLIERLTGISIFNPSF